MSPPCRGSMQLELREVRREEARVDDAGDRRRRTGRRRSGCRGTGTGSRGPGTTTASSSAIAVPSIDEAHRAPAGTVAVVRQRDRIEPVERRARERAHDERRRRGPRPAASCRTARASRAATRRRSAPTSARAGGSGGSAAGSGPRRPRRGTAARDYRGPRVRAANYTSEESASCADVRPNRRSRARVLLEALVAGARGGTRATARRRTSARRTRPPTA